MLDLETMGNKSNAALISIGAVEFNIESGEIGRKFYKRIDLQSSLDVGLIINASTVYWWLQQNEKARNEVCNPKILLLDEPFSALDIRNRTELQNILLNLFYNDKIDVTFILVTHDIREAVFLSNRIYMMKTDPAEIHKEYLIDLNVPKRTQNVKYSDVYLKYVETIETDFNNLI